jgi:hypothetical protein
VPSFDAGEAPRRSTSLLDAKFDVGANGMDMITRYFLRRLAISLPRKQWASASGPYHEALVEVILVFIALPAVAVLSFVGLSTMRWCDPIVHARWPWLGFGTVGLIIWLLSVLVGHYRLGKRLRQYRDDPSKCAELSSGEDRRIAFRQKFTVIVVCGVIAPWLGIAVNEFSK